MTLHHLRWVAGLPALVGGMYGVAIAQPATEARLPEIMVHSTLGGTSLEQTPASVSVIDADQMRDRQLQVNLSESLSGVPGLQINNRQNYAQDLQLSVRGYGARSTFGLRGVRLYVDGIPATMPDGQGALSHIDISSLERVEVLRGPYSALYGNSAGGVISMYTETPTGRPTVEGGYSVGSNGQKRISGKASGQTAQGLSYVLSASRYLTDGYRDHSAADRNVANAKLSTAIGDDARLTIVANTMKSNAQDAQGLTWEQWQANPRRASFRADNGEAVAEKFNTRKSLEQTQVGATYERRLSGTQSVSLTAYAGHRSMEQYQSLPVATQAPAGHAGGVIDMSRDYAGLDARWTGRFDNAPVPVTVTAGLAFDTMKEDRQGYENFIGSQLGVKGALRRNEDNTVTSIDPYVQATWQLAPTWSLGTGLRYSHVKFESDDRYIRAGNPDDSGSVTHSQALPVISLSHQLTPEKTVYVSAGRGFETPTFAELSYRTGSIGGLNLDLQPSASTQYEVGFRERLTGAVKGGWSAALFHSRTSDEIVSAGASNGRTTYRNAGDTRRQGLELQADLRLAPQWKVQAAYTYLDATFRQASGSAAAGNMLPGLSKQHLSVGLDYDLTSAWRLGVSAEHASKVYVNDANSASAPGYTVAAASVGYRKVMGPWTLRAFARVDNLFDRKYVGSVIVNDGNSRFFEGAPGRQWMTGISAAYQF
ncbi:TonB-dependent receptor [Acidovorax sp. CCYZU-2555]|uniref:TonB-dependent receptor n=1 Tax=Acidovorax sp. CCYZU-2555 TaxID=2835042 RepID=UPI001BD031B7|nr:TonB-dependent receptor [Acidovorax sp. CCYZU-2555]MBS7778745.1 TonB-dependent receptor [Acidovorax sp. CCYZU-2555]